MTKQEARDELQKKLIGLDDWIGLTLCHLADHECNECQFDAVCGGLIGARHELDEIEED